MQRKAWPPQEYFVYFKAGKCTAVKKRPDEEGLEFARVCPNKKGAGRIVHSPRIDSHFAMSDYSLWCPTGHKRLCRQNLAALCTATSQNLTAIGSSHSLTETVNLGTMTTAGLIGTLHVVYTSLKSQYARQPKWPQQHIVTDYT